MRHLPLILLACLAAVGPAPAEARATPYGFQLAPAVAPDEPAAIACNDGSTLKVDYPAGVYVVEYDDGVAPLGDDPPVFEKHMDFPVFRDEAHASDWLTGLSLQLALGEAKLLSAPHDFADGGLLDDAVSCISATSM